MIKKLSFCSRAATLALCAAFGAQLQAEDGNSVESRITLVFEWFEMDRAEWTKWMADPESAKKTDDELREQVQQLLEAGEASLVDMSILSTRSGSRAKAESIAEIIYPTELSGGAELSATGKAATPPNAAAFETRNVGTTVEVDSVLENPARIVDPFSDVAPLPAGPRRVSINMTPELVRQVGEIVLGRGINEVRQPEFHTLRPTTSITLDVGSSGLLGSMRPRVSLSGEWENPIVLQFVRVEVHDFDEKQEEADEAE